MNITKTLKSFSDQAASAIEATGGSSLVVIAKEITLDEFGIYLTTQMAKAEADLTSGDMVTAAARLQSLMCSAAQVEASFNGAAVEKAVIPMISDSSAAATKALGDAAASAANLAELAKKARGEGTEQTDKNEGGDEDSDDGGEDEEDVSKDDGDWSGSDLNNDPALRKLLDDGKNA